MLFNRVILYDDKAEHCMTGNVYSIETWTMEHGATQRLTLDITLDPYKGNVSNKKLAKEVAGLTEKKQDLEKEVTRLEERLYCLQKEVALKNLKEEKPKFSWRYE